MRMRRRRRQDLGDDPARPLAGPLILLEDHVDREPRPDVLPALPVLLLHGAPSYPTAGMDAEGGGRILSGDSRMARAVSFLTVDKKGRATLPEEVRLALGVEAGDLILLERTKKGTFELIPAALVPKDQLWFHHPEMQKRIGRAESDFAAGRSTRTETPEEAQALLDSLKTRAH